MQKAKTVRSLCPHKRQEGLTDMRYLQAIKKNRGNILAKGTGSQGTGNKVEGREATGHLQNKKKKKNTGSFRREIDRSTSTERPRNTHNACPSSHPTPPRKKSAFLTFYRQASKRFSKVTLSLAVRHRGLLPIGHPGLATTFGRRFSAGAIVHRRRVPRQTGPVLAPYPEKQVNVEPIDRPVALVVVALPLHHVGVGSRRPVLYELLHPRVGEVVAAPQRPVLHVRRDVVREHVGLEDDVSLGSRGGAREHRLLNKLRTATQQPRETQQRKWQGMNDRGGDRGQGRGGDGGGGRRMVRMCHGMLGVGGEMRGGGGGITGHGAIYAFWDNGGFSRNGRIPRDVAPKTGENG